VAKQQVHYQLFLVTYLDSDPDTCSIIFHFLDLPQLFTTPASATTGYLFETKNGMKFSANTKRHEKIHVENRSVGLSVFWVGAHDIARIGRHSGVQLAHLGSLCEKVFRGHSGLRRVFFGLFYSTDHPGYGQAQIKGY
jgi:hypothetical protein